MAREYRILHHRQSGAAGGHWDLVENPIVYRTASSDAPQGDGSLCAALQKVGADGWVPIMELGEQQAQSGETFILLARQ